MQVRQEKLMKSQNNANSYTDDVYNAIKSKELIKDVIYFDEIDSTNKFAKYNNTKDGSLIIAGYQSNGRGRLNHLWESSKDKNILILDDTISTGKTISEMTKNIKSISLSIGLQFHINTCMKALNEDFID